MLRRVFSIKKRAFYGAFLFREFLQFRDVCGQFNQAVGIAPFVVVPADNVDQISVNNRGGIKVNNRRMRISNEIAADEFFVGRIKNSLKIWFFGGFAERVVDFFLGGWTSQ